MKQLFAYVFMAIRADSDMYIPLSITSNEVEISASIDGILDGQPVNRPITFSHTSLISFQSNQSSVLSNRTVRFGEFEYTEPNLIFVPFGRSVLGIGPGSGLMRSFGPMAIVNSTWLVLNSTEEYFNQLCLEESISYVTVAHSDLLQGLTFQASMGLVSGSRALPTIAFQILFRNIQSGLILEVPEMFRNVLIGLFLEDSDLRVVEDAIYGFRFDRCPSFQLPSIGITIADQIRLLIHPEDYLKQDTNGCSLLIGQSNSNMISLNPFLLNGVHFRVDQGSREADGKIFFCDSQDTFLE